VTKYQAFQNPALRYINPSSDSPGALDKTHLNKSAKEFKDVSLAFTPHPITKDLTIVRNERSINNAVRNLIMFHFGDVPFQQDIGSDVRNYMFEVVDEATADFIEREIERVIVQYEPRVKIKGEFNDIPFNFGEVTPNMSYTNYPGTAGNKGHASINQFLKETDQQLGVYATVNDEANNIEVTIIYQIVGYDQVFTVNHILYPTRV
jgi:phage baseplate assembly protein W